tara:strand:- start:15553 stop:16425 length:873 start_codon:yes stop_codon:yes gene_type:complete
MKSQNIDNILSKYKLIICDIWGVLHNGYNFYSEAVNALSHIIDNGCTLLLLTNAPRSSDIVREYLINMGIDKKVCKNIISSGDLTQDWLSNIEHKPLYHIGPSKDGSIFDSIKVNKVSLEDSHECLCTGFFDEFNETIDNYENILNMLNKRNIVIHCANPDLYVKKGNKTLPCAGLIAESYKKMGGKVVYFGKPYSSIYDFALHKAMNIRNEELKKSDILAIGDGLETDILGANNYGLDCLFIINGVHKNEIKDYFSGSNYKTADIYDFIASKHSKIKPPKYIEFELKLI